MEKIRERFIAFEKEQKLQLSKLGENGKAEFAEQLDFLQLGNWCSDMLPYICRENGNIVIFYEFTERYGDLAVPDIVSIDGRYNCFVINQRKEMVVIEDKGDEITITFVGLGYDEQKDGVSFWTNNSKTSFVK